MLKYDKVNLHVPEPLSQKEKKVWRAAELKSRLYVVGPSLSQYHLEVCVHDIGVLGQSRTKEEQFCFSSNDVTRISRKTVSIRCADSSFGKV